MSSFLFALTAILSKWPEALNHTSQEVDDRIIQFDVPRKDKSESKKYSLQNIFDIVWKYTSLIWQYSKILDVWIIV